MTPHFPPPRSSVAPQGLPPPSLSLFRPPCWSGKQPNERQGFPTGRDRHREWPCQLRRITKAARSTHRPNSTAGSLIQRVRKTNRAFYPGNSELRQDGGVTRSDRALVRISHEKLWDVDASYTVRGTVSVMIIGVGNFDVSVLYFDVRGSGSLHQSKQASYHKGPVLPAQHLTDCGHPVPGQATPGHLHWGKSRFGRQALDRCHR